MDWKTYKERVRNFTSQIYDIVVDEMKLSDWNKFFDLIEKDKYIQSFDVVDSEQKKFVGREYLWEYFKKGSEYCPSIKLEVGELKLDIFLENKNELEIWLKDNDQSREGLTESKYNRLLNLMFEISKNLEKDVSFMHEDGIGRYLIFRISKSEFIKKKKNAL
jgi:hypothetical protein